MKAIKCCSELQLASLSSDVCAHAGSAADWDVKGAGGSAGKPGAQVCWGSSPGGSESFVELQRRGTIPKLIAEDREDMALLRSMLEEMGRMHGRWLPAAVSAADICS